MIKRSTTFQRLFATFASALSCSWLAACADVDDSSSELATRVDCSPSHKTDIVLTIDSGSGKQPNDEDLTITGQATQANGLTIREVIVQGVIANNDGFNYSAWSATVPIAGLLARANDDGKVTVSVEALDACGKTNTAGVAVQLVAPP